ncbi:universal stress protein [Aequorivita marina]|uniref:universal stress protein n=1 Tax=Aequorivita marina TaxID=3073654 RepID=UPI00287543E8|nr:universal stress protein [Aequorivita sp. S2608]MDS1297946.1 universal stress protein [Aequorivita sp. S2608]
MKKILVPTDFSDNAYSALCYVSKLYSAESLQITVLHSFNSEVESMGPRMDIKKSEALTKTLLKESVLEGDQMIKRLKVDAPKLKHDFKVLATPAMLSDSIDSLVVNEGYDLVVMGSKGQTGAEDILMGSTTDRIVNTLEACPLLIVPEQVEFSMPTEIAFASDYNEFYSLSELKPITRLVRQYGSNLNIVNVGSEADLDKKQKLNFEKFNTDLTEYNSNFYFVPKRGSVSKTLFNFIDEKNIALFALIYHKHNFIKQLFREPVVSRLGEHMYVPTLVIPQQY